MKLDKRVVRYASFVLCVLFCLPAKAVEPSEFEKKPLSLQCQQMILNYFNVLSLKKEGLERQQAHSISTQLKLGQGIPVDAIERAYDYPELSDSYLASYAHFSCKAKEENYPILPFESLVETIKECQRKTYADDCDNELRNKIIGYPIAYRKGENRLRPALTGIESMTKAPPIVTVIRRVIKLESIGCKIAYPEESRSNKQTGVTTVEITLSADGTLKEARVDKSSGYRQLDKATKNGLEACKLSMFLQEGFQPDSKFLVSYSWILE